MTDSLDVGTAYGPTAARSYDQQRFRSASGRHIHKVESGILRRYIAQLPEGASVLEVGCGTGRLILEYSQLSLHLTASDASESMLAELRARMVGSAASIRLEQAEAASMPFTDDSYDLVYAIRLLNQTESPAYASRVVAETIRVCKPGGTSLIEFANKRRPRLGGNRHESTRLTPSEVVATARRSGAQLTAIEGAFFLGMGATRYVPEPFLPVLGTFDRWLASLMPGWCARVYVAVVKDAV